MMHNKAMFHLLIPGEFPAQRPVTRSFDVFFDLRLNKRLSKQSWGCWLSRPLWRHCNENLYIRIWIVSWCTHIFTPLQNISPIMSTRMTSPVDYTMHGSTKHKVVARACEKWYQINRLSIFTEASFGLWVLSLPASVCVSVRPCVR